MPEIANSILKKINRNSPDIVIITDNLTENRLVIIKNLHTERQNLNRNTEHSKGFKYQILDSEWIKLRDKL